MKCPKCGEEIQESLEFCGNVRIYRKIKCVKCDFEANVPYRVVTESPFV